MEVKTDIFHAVADPHRRQLLDLLRTGEKPAGELVEHFDLTFPGISQHLKVLKNAGLVKTRRQGRYHYYRVNPSPLRDIHEWITQYEQFWKGRLKKLGQHLGEAE
ncbi:MAG: transcriptional regulator [Nitrospirales bacterium]|nr:MAG: transcriptional regulator [Nitrospirales bacterium]